MFVQVVFPGFRFFVLKRCLFFFCVPIDYNWLRFGEHTDFNTCDVVATRVIKICHHQFFQSKSFQHKFFQPKLSFSPVIFIVGSHLTLMKVVKLMKWCDIIFWVKLPLLGKVKMNQNTYYIFSKFHLQTHNATFWKTLLKIFILMHLNSTRYLCTQYQKKM